MSYQDPRRDRPMIGEVRISVPLPLFVPLIAAVVIAVLAIGFSKVLLAVPPEAATVIAIATAANILGASAFIALKPRVGGSTYMELLAIIIYPVLIGIVVAQVGIGEEGHDAHAGERAPITNGEEEGETGAGLTVVAENTSFDVSEIRLEADAPAEIEFVNEDSDRHNIAIYEDQETGLTFENALFQGEIIAGPDTITYSFTAPPAGEYHFQCDVHANMRGTVVSE